MIVIIEAMTFTDSLISNLESKSWHCQENVLTSDLCTSLLETMSRKQLNTAGIGKGHQLAIEPEIRDSQTHWIENWEELPELHFILSELMQTMNQNFYLSLKRFESQFAFYSTGGFYKKHIDQHQKTNNRLVTCIFYLNDCPAGGELVLFNKDDKMKIDCEILPKKGSMAIFFAGHIYHEVKPVVSERYSLTTWMRDDELVPLY